MKISRNIPALIKIGFKSRSPYQLYWLTLRNAFPIKVNIIIPDYTASHPKTQQYSQLPTWQT